MLIPHAAGDRFIDLVALRERLADNAFLFDDPDTYNAGVSDTLDVIREELQVSGKTKPTTGTDT